MELDLIQLIGTFGGLLTGGAVGFLSKSGRVKAKADAYKAMAEAYEYRIKALHETIETCNATIKELQQRIADLNHALDDKTDMIRKYVEDIIKAEAELNRVNSLMIETQKELARLEKERDHYRMWRCYREHCSLDAEEGCDRRKPKQPIPVKYVPLDEDETVRKETNVTIKTEKP